MAQTDASGLIDQLADYSDYGIQTNESTGWDALAGFTGEADDPTAGLNNYAARSYQPGTGTWTAADSWRGDLGSPQTLNRYAYTTGNPTTLIDVGGNRPWDPAFTVTGKNAGGWVLEKAKPPKTGTVTSLAKPKPAKPKAKTASGRTRAPASHDEWNDSFAWSKDVWSNVGMDKCSIYEPRCIRPGGRASVYCSDITLATAPSATCTMDFRPETVAGKALDLLLLLPAGRLLRLAFEAKAAAAVGKSAASSSRVLLNTEKQLQQKFKHASDFGVSGNYDKSNAAAFSRAINQHIDAKGTQAIQGSYRGTPVTHYLDPRTGLNVIADESGAFVSGWRLSPGQLENVLRRGAL